MRKFFRRSQAAQDSSDPIYATGDVDRPRGAQEPPGELQLRSKAEVMAEVKEAGFLEGDFDPVRHLLVRWTEHARTRRLDPRSPSATPADQPAGGLQPRPARLLARAEVRRRRLREGRGQLVPDEGGARQLPYLLHGDAAHPGGRLRRGSAGLALTQLFAAAPQDLDLDLTRAGIHVSNTRRMLFQARESTVQVLWGVGARHVCATSSPGSRRAG